MDEIYRARLSGSPPHPPAPVPHAEQAEPKFSILPHPPHPPGGPNPGPGPIPIQLPNIYVNPFPPPAPSPPQMAPSSIPPNVPTMVAAKGAPKAWWKSNKPHPLLWVSLAISLLALILEVPKGALPTITRRHQALRMHEKQVQERLHLLSKLSTFLPPPLASIVTQSNGHGVGGVGGLELFTPEALRFWSAHHAGGMGREGEWWSVEDLGSGAQVVRSKGEGKDREVWVISTGGEGGDETSKPLLDALTHSLLLRDRLLAELTALKNSPAASAVTSIAEGTPRMSISPRGADDEELRKERKEDFERQEERKRRERERERDIEEREMEVARREKWVVEEMRKISDKVHSQATELTLEDRITERMKAYQRQLAHLGQEKHDTAPAA